MDKSKNIVFEITLSVMCNKEELKKTPCISNLSTELHEKLNIYQQDNIRNLQPRY